jgi:XTP/dITP diphosphohydrolase
MPVSSGAVIILTDSAYMTLLLATTNPGKVREIRLALADLDLTVLTIDDVAAGLTSPEETGATFAENAAIKATSYAQHTGLPTVAEDSGLSIDALGGRPGVESARYPGDTYNEKFARLYQELAPWPRPWTARFTCAVAFRDPRGARGPFAGAASVEGEVARAPRGLYGFGYDPIFFFPPHGCTTGEMTDVQKLAISHRGRAFRHFRDWLGASG